MEQNITEEKFNESLLKSKSLYHILFENTSDAIIITEGSKIIDCNKAAFLMFGCSSKEDLTNNFPFPGLLPDRTPSTGKILKLISSPSPETIEKFNWEYLKVDGTILDTEITFSSFSYENHDLQQYTIRDNKFLKKHEKELNKADLKYKKIFENIQDVFYRIDLMGNIDEIRKVDEQQLQLMAHTLKSINECISITDIEDRILFINEAFIKTYGFEEEELIGQNISMVRSPNTDPNVVNEILDITTVSGWQGEILNRRKDGSDFTISLSTSVVRNEKGEILGMVGVAIDISERKQVENELQELNATKDKFFSIIAHDLKSPFNSITGLSEIIKDEAKHLNIETIEQYAEIIHSTSQNTYRLLENLLDWALVQQSRMPFRPGTVILKKIVDEIIEFLNEMANSKMITVINSVPKNLLVVADEDMLKTILRNLISNALKFTSTNGKVVIKAISRPDEVEITVKDSGTGIEKKDIVKIFKFGSTYSKRGTENEKGTGLGLALCKEFVEKHGGKIWVESEAGKGSDFKFVLPGS